MPLPLAAAAGCRWLPLLADLPYPSQPLCPPYPSQPPWPLPISLLTFLYLRTRVSLLARSLHLPYTPHPHLPYPTYPTYPTNPTFPTFCTSCALLRCTLLCYSLLLHDAQLALLPSRPSAAATHAPGLLTLTSLTSLL